MISPFLVNRKLCVCGRLLNKPVKYCSICKERAYTKVKDRAQRLWLKRTGKDTGFYRRTNPEFKASCKLRDFVYWNVDKIKVGDIL